MPHALLKALMESRVTLSPVPEKAHEVVLFVSQAVQ
jgi:hypothetical protein